MGMIDGAIVIAYFIALPLFGAWVGRKTHTLREFFLAGRRFPGWLVGFSCVATVVGSYSFVKYASAGYRFGISSSQTYFNDWIWMPLFLFGWLPMLYAAGILSVPEFFRRRFSPATGTAAAVVLLLYLVGYIGINLFTIGKALEALFGIDLFLLATIVTALCLLYEFSGGQTSVILTDLVQAALLLFAGLYIFIRGIALLGGFGEWVDALPEGFLRPLPAFNEQARFNFVGVFWQDGLAGGVVFYFMNQGILLRFLSARSLAHSRRAALWVLLALMPLAAVAVSGAGWVGAAMTRRGLIAEDVPADEIFVHVTGLLTGPGMFGLVIAALLAALMSTADTLINASSAIVVNDLWQPGGSEKKKLRAARISSLAAALAGLSLVPFYRGFDSIYEAHGAFTASITPPLAVTLLLAILWPRFPPRAAFVCLVGGTLLMALSLRFPELVVPFSHGIPAEGGFKYIRAAYGVAASLLLALVATPFCRPRPLEELDGLTLWTFRMPKPAHRLRKRFHWQTTKSELPRESSLMYFAVGDLPATDSEQDQHFFAEPTALITTGRHGRRFRYGGFDADLPAGTVRIEPHEPLPAAWRKDRPLRIEAVEGDRL